MALAAEQPNAHVPAPSACTDIQLPVPRYSVSGTALPAQSDFGLTSGADHAATVAHWVPATSSPAVEAVHVSSCWNIQLDLLATEELVSILSTCTSNRIDELLSSTVIVSLPDHPYMMA